MNPHVIPWLQRSAAYALWAAALVLGVQRVDGQIFQNHASEWGISQYNWNGVFGAAVSTADWNDDGWPDLTFGATDGSLRTLKNLEGTGFEVVPLPWNMASETTALIWVDLDNDGDDDLFVQEASGRCGLIRNNGNGTFSNVTLISGLPQDVTEAAGASFGDMDNDGDLDLHLCRYLEYVDPNEPSHLNVLMRNNGDLTFTNVSESSGIDVHLRLSFQGIWWDQNDDGWQDIFVINDKIGANAMFRNNGDGTFTDVAPELNMNLVMDCMSATLGDFNQDTRLDLFLTNTPFGGDGLGSKLLMGMADGTYSEVASSHGLNLDRWCWGAAWMDADNDMDLDLFVTEHEFLNPYGINYLYENQGNESGFTFEPFGEEVYGIDYLNSHVVATADIDRNGWVDFVVHNLGNHAARIWMNSGFSNGNTSVGIHLQGTFSNRPAAGSRIRVHAGGVVQSRIVHVGENYLSQENEVELFGLGSHDLSLVEIQWPSGLHETFDASLHNLTPFSQHTLVEGHSPCPESEVAHEVCAGGPALQIPAPPAPFEALWTSANGEELVAGDALVWDPTMGNFQMTATWNGVETCSVSHHVTLIEVPGDLDADGSVAASDLLELFSQLGCTSGCFADLNQDGIVNVSDLLTLLTLVGQSCF